MTAIDWSILGPALCAGFLVLASHIPLGQQVLKRGIVFLDLAVAQIAGLGVICAASFELHDAWQIQLCALIAALVGALLIYLVERFWQDIQEAVIGCLFVLSASIGILLLHQNPHGGEALKDLLSGQILWVSYTQLIPMAIITAAVLLAWFGWRNIRNGCWFYLLFALVITSSVQLVGVYLVFASLIMPALAVMNCQRKALPWAMLIGASAYFIGLICSAWFDLPSGAAIVCCLALLSFVGLVVSRYQN